MENWLDFMQKPRLLESFFFMGQFYLVGAHEIFIQISKITVCICHVTAWCMHQFYELAASLQDQLSDNGGT